MGFIHSKALIEGEVELGENVSVWAFAVIRADEGKIVIGRNSSIQEGTVIHGNNVFIGENVTVGHAAVIHGARIGDNCLIGINSTILDGAEIGEWSIIAAGSVVTPNTKILSHSVVMGSPGKVVRKIEEKDKKLICKSYANYLKKIKKNKQ
ncbi:MAG: gamma carbonic anhydrase family protein [archaeon]